MEDEEDATSVPPSRTQRRRASDASENFEEDTQIEDTSTTSLQQMIKNLVRLALACEYSRIPIRRADISSKVMGPGSRQFRAVFDGAQLALRQTFGMEMVELPVREKVTLAQRRAAQKSQSSSTAASASSNTWILQSLLPTKFRAPEIIPPPKVPTEDAESAYVGLYSFVVSVITLSGGSLPEAKMDRYLKRTNIDRSTPVGETDKLFARMIKEGYIIRDREVNQGEELVEYRVSPRGKMEIGLEGVAGMVRAVYGDDNREELERRLERSLKVQAVAAERANAQQNGEDGVDGRSNGNKGKGRRRQARGQAEQSSSDEDD